MVAAKGAVEGILAHSQSTNAQRRAVLAANASSLRQGLRVLALAASA
jgi:magnesium-transporting ATPase (P-type)